MKKQIPEYSRYQIDTEGKIYDMKNGKIQPTIWNGDFLCTNLIRDDGVKVLCKIHRMMAITFVDNPHNANRVIHKDGDRSNNRVENIAWCPKKVKAAKVEETYDFCGKRLTLKEVSDLCGVSKSTIRHRLKSGWSVVECKLGYRNFQGTGIQTETHWFPSSSAKIEYERLIRKHEERLSKERRQLEYEALKLERINNMYCGVGINDAPDIEKHIKRRWCTMIHRCYNGKFHQKYPTYKDCSVVEEWRYLSKFADWCRESYVKNWHLDKDILHVGNKCYGPQYCVFIPAYINSLLWDSTTKTIYMHGVFKENESERYKVKVGRLGDVLTFSGFPDELSAHLRWQEEKVISILCAIDKYKTEPKWRQDVVEALLLRVEYLKSARREGVVVDYLM